MKIRNLADCGIDRIVHCFNEAFSDYVVKMPTDVDFWEKRWRGARVDYHLSYGVFDEGELVGFIIHGIDYDKGKLTAFNTGTGVIPKYRGQKLVKQIYKAAIPDLLENSVKKCTLEVIVGNDKAIKAYQSVGFKITKTLKCYAGSLKKSENKDLTLENLAFEDISWDQLPRQNQYSWDNRKSAIDILAKDYSYFEVLDSTSHIGYFIINPNSGNLAQFDLIESKNESHWQILFAAIESVKTNIKINNVFNNLTDKVQAIKKTGLNNVIDQYEMELLI